MLDITYSKNHISQLDVFMNYFLDHIKWYDETTGSDWRKTFPEIAQFYSNYI